MKREDHRSLGRLRSLHRGRVGFDTHDFFTEHILGSEKLNRVVVALAHLCAIESRHDRCGFLDHRLGQFENFAKGLVHLDRDVPGYLQMLLLVAPDWHDVAVVNQNIGGHQHGIGEEAMRRRDPARGLVLEGMAPLEESHRRYGAKDPGQLRDLRHIGLAEKHRAFRIESTGQKIQRQFADICAKRLGILHRGQRMQIGDEIKRLASLLKLDRGLHHSKIVAEMRRARGLDAGKNSHPAQLSFPSSRERTFLRPSRPSNPTKA